MNSYRMRLGKTADRSIFIDPDYYIWGGSIVRDPEGICHLFYSRWPRRRGMEAWVTHSQIAHATAADPLGPFEHREIALPNRGVDYWDGSSTHNPTIHEFDGVYYLYYTGNHGDQVVPEKELNWLHRNSQRIGVSVSHSPYGPWQRFDHPLIDVGAEEDDPDRLCVANPAITRMKDGAFLLIYKAVGAANPLPFGGPVIHLAATSWSPTGPFQKQPAPIFACPGEVFPTEDPYIWREGNSYYAIVKDFGGHFTGSGMSLALFCSDDGFDWKPAEDPLVSIPQIVWKDGRKETLHRLERPQVWLDRGRPKVLYCAASPNSTESHAFNVHIPVIQMKTDCRQE